MRCASWQLGTELPALHTQGRQNFVHGPRQLLRTRDPLRRQRLRRARELGPCLLPIGRDGAQVEIGGVEQLELARRGVTRGQHIRDRGSMLLLQPKQ